MTQRTPSPKVTAAWGALEYAAEDYTKHYDGPGTAAPYASKLVDAAIAFADAQRMGQTVPKEAAELAVSLARRDEREACARAAEEWADHVREDDRLQAMTAESVAAKIRRRTEQETATKVVTPEDVIARFAVGDTIGSVPGPGGTFTVTAVGPRTEQAKTSAEPAFSGGVIPGGAAGAQGHETGDAGGQPDASGRPPLADRDPVSAANQPTASAKVDESRYEPDRAKRCNEVRRRGDIVDVCNRTRGHANEHERWSYTGIRTDVWPADQLTETAQPAVVTIDMQTPKPKARGNHVHPCPNCYEHVPCDEVCDLEIDLFREGETPCGSYVECDGCTKARAQRSEAAQDPGLEKPTAAELLRRGGEWLGAARNWLKWHARNGDQVTWGSGDLIEPQLSVRQIEGLAAEVAAAAMRPQPSEERLANALKARWTAEAEVAQLRRESPRARVTPGHSLVAFESPTECEPCGEVWDAAAWVSCPRCQVTALRKVVEAARAFIEERPILDRQALVDRFEALLDALDACTAKARST